MAFLINVKWSAAWKNPSFRWKSLTGLALLIIILISFPVFFRTIQDRNGHKFSDFLLTRLPAYNVSILVFMFIWACCALLLIRIFRDPLMFLDMLWAYDVITLVRMSFIALISLNPPDGLIPLADPITNLFYGKDYITHDLFFSGHTTTVFLIFLCLKGKKDRAFALLASISVGVLLLVQHVHYTADVLAAPIFTYAVYRLIKTFTRPDYQAVKDFSQQ
jgi:PAP2 superfamily C-terminal